MASALGTAQRAIQQVIKDACETVSRAATQAASDLTQMQIAVSVAEASQAVLATQQ